MSWVEVYEYDLGFCLLWALITIIGNEQGRIGAQHKKRLGESKVRKKVFQWVHLPSKVQCKF